MKYDYERINELRYYFKDEPKWVWTARARVNNVYQDEVMVVLECTVDHNDDECFLNENITEVSFLLAKGPKEPVDYYEDRLYRVFANPNKLRPLEFCNWECRIYFRVKWDDRDDSYHYFLESVFPVEKT